MLHCLSGKENQLIQVIARHKNLRVQAITRIRIKPFSFAKPQAAGWDYNYYESHCFLLRQKQLKSPQMQFSFFFFSHHRLKECKEVLHCWSGKENQLIQVLARYKNLRVQAIRSQFSQHMNGKASETKVRDFYTTSQVWD